MSNEEKIQILTNALRLICKPSELCSESESDFINHFCGEDEIAYIALEAVDATPDWSIHFPISKEKPSLTEVRKALSIEYYKMATDQTE